MIGIKLIYLSCIVLLLKYIECLPANMFSSDCSDKVYRELGIKKSDDFCGTVNAHIKISSRSSKPRYELNIARFSTFWIAIELEDMNQILFNYNTPIFTRNVNVPDDEEITHCLTKEGMQPVGKFVLLQNLKQKTAVVLFEKKRVEGKINNTHLRYIPSIQQHVLIMKNQYLENMKHLIGRNHCGNNTHYKPYKVGNGNPMYYKVLVPLDFSFVKGKTYTEVLKTVLIFWNEVDMHFRLSLLHLEIALSVVGIILPHKSFSYLTTTADNLYSTIDPITVGNFFRRNTPVYHIHFDTIVTMTTLPLCDKWSNDNHCQRFPTGFAKFYKGFTDYCFPRRYSPLKYPKNYGAVILHERGTNSYSGEVAKLVREAFQLDDKECGSRNSKYLEERYDDLRTYPQTLTGFFMWTYTPVMICPTSIDVNKSHTAFN